MEYLIATFGVLIVLTGFYLISSARKAIKDVRKAQDWPHTQGEIIHCEIEETYTDGLRYQANIEYNYQVKGENYVNFDISIGWAIENTSNRESIESICKKYPLNSSQEIFYNPDAPEESYLELSAGSQKMVITIGSIFIIFGIIILIIFNSIRLGVIVPVI